MTTKIRAAGRRFPRVGGTPMGEPWLALVYTTSDSTDTRPDIYETTFAGSHAEALQHVETMRAQFDRQLMAEVHESRSSRWNARRKQILDEALASPCPNIPLIPTAHLHTMEATA